MLHGCQVQEDKSIATCIKLKKDPHLSTCSTSRVHLITSGFLRFRTFEQHYYACLLHIHHYENQQSILMQLVQVLPFFVQENSCMVQWCYQWHVFIYRIRVIRKYGMVGMGIKSRNICGNVFLYFLLLSCTDGVFS